MSNMSDGGKFEELVGIGQGNLVSGAICRDQSCLMFLKLESREKGAQIILPLTLKQVRRTEIECVDDADFYSNSIICNKKMQEIMNTCVNLREATGAKIQEEKVKFYCWKCRVKNGERAIEQIETPIIIKNKETQQIKINQRIRALGTHATPALKQKSRFEKLKEKAGDTIGKLISTSLTYKKQPL